MSAITNGSCHWSSLALALTARDREQATPLATKAPSIARANESGREAALMSTLIALLNEIIRDTRDSDHGFASSPPPAPPFRPPTSWLEVARGELGQRELPDGAHSARIVEYHATTRARFVDDETPWCSSFVNWVMRRAGFEGTDSARALSWRSYGNSSDRAVMGAIAVIDHGNGRGHVGFVVGRDGDNIVLLGGNQRNEVRYAAYPASVITEFRLPPGCPPPADPLPEIGAQVARDVPAGPARTRSP